MTREIYDKITSLLNEINQDNANKLNNLYVAEGNQKISVGCLCKASNVTKVFNIIKEWIKTQEINDN